MIPPPPSTPEKVTITQGVAGNVNIWQWVLVPETDCSGPLDLVPLPSPRVVYIYELTTEDDATPPAHCYGITCEPGFYESVSTLLLAEVEADEDGFFEFQLDPGDYSLFVEWGGLLYAPTWGQFFDATGLSSDPLGAFTVDLDTVSWFPILLE